MRLLLKYITVSIFIINLPVKAQSDTSITFSEIMFNPSAANSEFIELVNISDEPVNIADYKIIYASSSADYFIPSGDSILYPNGFALILEADYDLLNGVYTNMIPDSALVFSLDNNAFGRSGMANTSDRNLFLINETGDTVDSYIYSADNDAGISDEKIVLNFSNLNNWENSKTLNGTPGAKNSNSPLAYDLNLTALEVIPEFPIAGESAEIVITIENRGSQTSNNYNLNLFEDTDLDSTADSGELIFSQTGDEIKSGEVLEFSYIFEDLQQREYHIIAVIESGLDEDEKNNKKYLTFIVSGIPPQPNDLIINEIMYSPQDDEPEWIEIYNRSDKEINLRDWKIYDLTGSAIIIEEDLMLQSDEFLILSDDETITDFYDIDSEIVLMNLPSLNNSGDKVVIKNNIGKIIDSLEYVPSWGGSKGISLERIDSEAPGISAENWGSSLIGATPGYENSISPKDYDLRISNFSAVKDFVIMPKPMEFKIEILNNGRKDANEFSVNLFYDSNSDSIPQSNELIFAEQIENLNSGDSLITSYDYSGYAAGENYFIAEIFYDIEEKDFDNQAFTKVRAIETNVNRNDIIINEFMSAPFQDGAEWIEIFNRSDKIINIQNYQIADQSDTSKIIFENESLYPGEYFVISKDSAVINKYRLDSNFVVSSFPSLNNSGDKIILLDSLDRVIDSLLYGSGWEIEQGFSTERIDIEASSGDALNWALTKNIIGGTPGYINSVRQKEFDIALKKLYPSPLKPFVGSEVSLLALVKNIGKQNINFRLELFSDEDRDKNPDVLLEESSTLKLNAGDSLIYEFNYNIVLENDAVSFAAYAKAEGDEDTTNNFLHSSISPGTKPFSIIINEFKFLPEDEEPEWVELYNRTNAKINLNDWSISDLVTTPDSVVISDDDLFVKPNDYIILSGDSLIYNFYSKIPAPVYVIELPTFNNNFDGIVIKDSLGITIDSLFYYGSWSQRGYSVERISTEGSSNDSLNWSETISSERGTPGAINSIIPKQFDLVLDSLYVQPEYPELGGYVNLTVDVINAGSSDAINFEVRFFINDDLLEEKNYNFLSSGGSVKIFSENGIQVLDSLKVSAEIIYESDENPSNNSSEFILVPGYQNKTILINEIMFNPKSGNPEWIEFINASGDEVNLRDWAIGDLMPEEKIKIFTHEDIFIQPDEFFIITSADLVTNNPDLKFFQTNISLSNNEDIITLYDFRGAAIDSLRYNSKWGDEKGISLERVSASLPSNDSLNWKLSLSEDGNSCGEENSVKNIKSYSFSSIALNEIMFDPDIGNSEFIEIYNISTDSINIGGWTIEDKSGKNIFVSHHNTYLEPEEYFLIAADSLILNNYVLNDFENLNCVNGGMSLSKTGEKIFLKDFFGNVIDSVEYDDTWHNQNIYDTKNKSLEKISPALESNNSANWSTSVDKSGASPLRANSIFTPAKFTESGIEISPNPFSPDDDGFEDFTIINYKLSQSISQIRIRIFDSRGREVRSLADNLASAAEGSIIFDGLDNDGMPLRIGIYIVFFEALDNFSGVVETLKEVVVVARRL